MRMIIIKSISTLVGELIMPLSLPLSHHLKPQTAQPAVSGHPVKSGSPAGGVNSRDILKGEKAVAIHHSGLTYRLQATRLGKLILTK
jgi:hemin uptake protein HemP